MNKGMKNTFIAFGILALIFTAAAVTLFMVYPTINNGEIVGFGVKDALLNLENSYKYCFDKAQFALPYIEQHNLIVSVSQLVFTGLVFILVVLGIVHAAVKKNGAPVFGFIVLAISGFAGAFVIANGPGLLDKMSKLIDAKATVAVALVFMAVFAAACLAVLFALLTYFVSLGYASKRAKAKKEEATVIGELSEDKEVVQEPEEPVAPAVVAAPVVEPEPVAAEPEEEVEEEPVEEKEEPKEEAEEEKPQSGAIDQASLAALLREVVRDIVRDEIARSNLNQPQAQPAQGGAQSVTGATFGGPLVVQYFNGGINGVTPPVQTVVPAPQPQPEQPQPQPQPKEEPKEEPVPEELQPEPIVETPAEQVVVPVEPEEAPLDESVTGPVVEVKEAPKYERISFAERLLQSDKDVQDLYNEIKNEIVSYGVKSRISANGDTFRLHKKMYVRITVAGKALKLYFALDPKDYADSTLPIKDASNKEMYQDIPLVFKVKSGLSVRRCKDLIKDTMSKDGLEQGEVGKVNWIKELKAELASGKKKEAEDED